MCFSNSQHQKGVKIATEDIPVFKALKTNDEDELTSPVKTGTIWKIGKIKRVWFMRRWGVPVEINRGIHSGKDRYGASGFCAPIYNAVIPRGSIYWENKSEYVSNKLIIIGLLTD